MSSFPFVMTVVVVVVVTVVTVVMMRAAMGW
jgi:hypothetical protein